LRARLEPVPQRDTFFAIVVTHQRHRPV
jgi:hypothetical protein